MAHIVFVTSICDEFTNGLEQLDVPADTIFQLVRALEQRFPGIGRFLETRASIAVNGEVIHAWSSPISGDSEVLLFPKIAGGAR